MDQLFRIRDTIVKLYKRAEVIIRLVLRFLIGLLVFSLIDKLGDPMAQVSSVITPDRGTLFLVLLALLFAVLPMTFGYTLMVLDIGMQMSGTLLPAIVVVLALFFIMVFYVRLAPRENMFVLAVILGYYFKLPFLIPLIAGMYFGITSIIPITIGVFIWNFIPSLGTLTAALGDTSAISLDNIADLPATFGGFYDTVLNLLKTNTNWIVISFVFAMTVLVVYGVSRLSFNFAKELSIVGGALFCMVLTFAASLMSNIDISVGGTIGGTLASLAIMFVIRFFDCVLDYKHAESTNFQDEDNVYYVKVIPKIKSS